MPRRAHGISAAKVAKARPGRYGDGGGLYLLVRSPEAKFWVFRYVRGGRMREMGLGPAAGRTAVSLADARLYVVRAFRTWVWQFKRVSGSSGLKVQAAIACWCRRRLCSMVFRLMVSLRLSMAGPLPK